MGQAHGVEEGLKTVVEQAERGGAENQGRSQRISQPGRSRQSRTTTADQIEQETTVVQVNSSGMTSMVVSEQARFHGQPLEL